MLKAAALAGLIFTLASPAVASADTSTISPMVGKFVAMGETFWQERGVQPCPSPVVVRGSLESEGADGAVQADDSCRIWVSDTLIRDAEREKWRSRRGGDSLREELCTTIFHELGHTAGLQHTPTGLMSPIGATVPGDCHVWRVRQDRKQRAAAKRKRQGAVRMTG
jgi:hypothetical protein